MTWKLSLTSSFLCRIDPREVRFARTMIFAIEEINNSTVLLPDVKLGYQIHDSCASVPVAVHAAFQLTNGPDSVFYGNNNCSQSGVVIAVVGESGSTPSISILRIIGSFNIPQVTVVFFISDSWNSLVLLRFLHFRAWLFCFR